MICPQCNQPNTTLQWWLDENHDRWVCLPCGMGRREEQNLIEAKWYQDHPNHIK
jgi:Zn ribbon nucleic-acid-binding protein